MSADSIVKCIRPIWEIIFFASYFNLKFLSQVVNEILQFCDLGGGEARLECGGEAHA